MSSPDDDGWPFANHASSALPEPTSKRKDRIATRSTWQHYASSLYGDYHYQSDNGFQVPWRFSSARKKVKRRNSDWFRPNRRRRWQRDLGISDREPSWEAGTFRFLNASNSTTNEPVSIVAASQNTGATIPPAPTPHHNLDLILDVVFIFLSGLAIIVGLIVVVYALVVLCDRYCRCGPRLAAWTDEMFSEWEAELEGNNSIEEEEIAAAAEAFGPVALKARLWGLTLPERRAVLDRVFAKHCRKYTLTTKKTLDVISSTTDGSSTKPPGLTHSNSSNSKTSTPEESSISTTYVDASSTASDSTYRQLSVDLEGGGSSERVVSHGPSVDADDDSSIQIPAQIRGKRLSGSKEECSDDTISELGAEAEVNATDDQKEAAACLNPVFFDERRAVASCAICLVEYSEGDTLLHGNHCSHIFHSDCIMAWMEDCHDHCPYCRVEMMTPEDMRRAATKVLSKERVQELTYGPRKRRR